MSAQKPALHRVFKAILPQYSIRDWLWFVFPTALFVSFLISAGPFVQDVLSRSIGSNEPTLYGAAYSEGINHTFPALTDWLMMSLAPVPLAAALMASVLALRHHSFATQSASLSLWVAAALSAGDATAAALYPDRNIDLIACLMYNIAGGCGVGIGHFLATLLYIKVFDLVSGGIVYKRILPAAAMALSGVACSYSIYSGLTLLYQVTPVRISVGVGATRGDTTAISVLSSGEAKPRPIEGNASDQRDFSAIPRSEVRGNALFTNVEGEVGAIWEKVGPETRFDLEVYAFLDCPSHEAAQLPASVPIIVAHDVRHIEARIDDGLSFINMPVSGFLSVYGTNYSDFYIGEATENRQVRLSSYLPDRTLAYYTTNDDIILSIAGSLVGLREELVVPSSRVFQITIDGTPRFARISSATTLDDKSKLDCRQIESLTFNRGPDGQAQALSTQGYFATILLKLKRTDAGGVFRSENQQLSISNLGGWLTLSGVPEEYLRSKYLGSLNTFELDNGWTYLQVGERSFEASQEGHFVAHGEFSAAYDNAGNLRIAGSAKAVWRNRVRVNLTRWEMMAVELRLFIITSLIALLGSAAAFVVRSRAVGSEDRRARLTV